MKMFEHYGGRSVSEVIPNLITTTSTAAKSANVNANTNTGATGGLASIMT